ncbi:MAG: MarR family transcriptional regulator [Desulfobacteraceae bacterium]|nr:MarR family transcriptional regulator [Desulfobacteraceae bacterium]
MNKIQDHITSCLFFNTNALSRQLSKMAEKEFKKIDLAPAHGTLMLVVYDNPGINPKELSRHLFLTPSTITRFVDALVKKGLLTKKTKGKSAFIHPTQKGLSLKSTIAQTYKSLYEMYTNILGEDQVVCLSQQISQASGQISNFLDNNG